MSFIRGTSPAERKSESYGGKFAIKIFKGTPKKRGISKSTKKEYVGYGQDLGEWVRLVPANEMIAKIIKTAYVKAFASGDAIEQEYSNKEFDVGGDPSKKEVIVTHFLMKRLVITFLSGDPEKVFSGGMFLRKANKVLQVCNRHTIHQKRETKEDRYGQPFHTMVACDERCEIAEEESLGTVCPRGCMQEGVLIFTLPELVRAGINMPCRLVTHSWKDILDIQELLATFKGLSRHGINCAEVAEESYFGLEIPYILSRYRHDGTAPRFDPNQKIEVAGKQRDKRTGERMEKIDYPLTLGVEPVWYQWYIRARSRFMNQQRGLGSGAEVKLLGGDVTDSWIDAEYSTPLIAQRHFVITEEMIENAKRGIRPDQLDVILKKADNNPEKFGRMVEQAAAMNWAIDSGFDKALARQIFDECGYNIIRFRQAINERLKQVQDVEIVGEAEDLDEMPF